MEIHKRHEGLVLCVSRVRGRVAYTTCTIDDIVYTYGKTGASEELSNLQFIDHHLLPIAFVFEL